MTLTIKLPPRAKPLEIQLEQIDRIIDKLLSKADKYRNNLYDRVVNRRNQIISAWYDERESHGRVIKELNLEGDFAYAI